jgi:Co/Zn/Cd efflux system component
MADCCCDPPPLKLDRHRGNDRYRRVLWIVLAINAIMFLVEIGAGLAAGSASLQADALDFLGDASNYAISLLGVGMALHYRASAALAKGATMGAFGVWVTGTVIWHTLHGTLPSAFTMGAVGFAALVANAASFGLLCAFREGDANMRSAWICTRNDVLGNLAVLLAAAGVFGTGTGWLAGRTSSSQPSWLGWHYKARQPLSDNHLVNCASQPAFPLNNCVMSALDH